MKPAYCKHCGALIVLIKAGKTDESYKWVTDAKDKATWKCGHDPRYPTQAHCPPDSYFEPEPES